MKRCLTCKRVYSDESLNFCRDDGDKLLILVPAVADEAVGTLPLGARARAGAATHVLGNDGAAHETVPPTNVETNRLKESSPEGVRTRRRRLAVLLAVLIVAGTALALYIRSRNARVPIESIAVLPLTSENGDDVLKDLPEDSEWQHRLKLQEARNKELEKHSARLTENILYNLPRLPNLRIVLGNAASRYRGKDTRIMASAGRELEVHAVFSGSMYQVGDRLTISVALVDARYNEHIWGARYDDCKVEELDARQQFISQKLADCLRLNRQGKPCEN